MKREISKMYLWAIAKIIFVLIAAFALFICFKNQELETGVIIFLSLLWGCVFLIYLFSGIRTIITGAKQAKEYMANSTYSVQRLDEEYNNAQSFGRIHVGNNHVFANASNQFYIIPLKDIENVWVKNYRANPLKARKGYYYLYIQVKDFTKNIKIYYALKGNAYAAQDCIMQSISSHNV